jgi:hypothetical protein
VLQDEADFEVVEVDVEEVPRTEEEQAEVDAALKNWMTHNTHQSMREARMLRKFWVRSFNTIIACAVRSHSPASGLQYVSIVFVADRNVHPYQRDVRRAARVRHQQCYSA